MCCFLCNVRAAQYRLSVIHSHTCSLPSTKMLLYNANERMNRPTEENGRQRDAGGQRGREREKIKWFVLAHLCGCRSTNRGRCRRPGFFVEYKNRRACARIVSHVAWSSSSPVLLAPVHSCIALNTKYKWIRGSNARTHTRTHEIDTQRWHRRKWW